MPFDSRCLQQWHQPTACIEGHQVVAAPNMGFANEYLRHSAAPRKCHHGGALRGGLFDVNLIDAADATSCEQLLGAAAIGAVRGGEHLHGLHS